MPEGGGDGSGREKFRKKPDSPETKTERDVFELPKVDKETGIYVDEQGGEWAQRKSLERLLGVAAATLQSRASEVVTIPGVGRTGDRTTLYSVSDARERLKSFLELPSTDPETGLYIDSDGVEWAPMKVLSQKFGVSDALISRKISDIPTLAGRYRGAGETVLYPVERVLDRLRPLLELPSVDQITGIYTDSEGTEWAQISTLTKLLGVSNSAVEPRVADLSTMRARGKSGEEATLYSITDAREKLTELTARVSVDSVTGIYTDPEGKEWAGISTLEERYGVGSNAVRARLDGLPTLSGRKNGIKTTLYPVAEMGRRLEIFSDLVEVDPVTGMHTDAEGNVWAHMGQVATLLGVDRSALYARLSDLEKKVGKNHTGVPTDFYRIDQARDRMQRFLSLVRPDPETGIYTDPEGREWASPGFFVQHLGLSEAVLNSRIPDIQTLQGREARSGREVRFLPIDEVKNRMKEYLALPMVNADTSIYTDSEGKEWAVANRIKDIVGVTMMVTKSRLKGSVSIPGRSAEGKEVKLYPVQDVREGARRLLELPVPDPKTKVYTDAEGTEWVSQKTLGALFDLHSTTVPTRLGDVRSIAGREGGQETRLYPLGEAQKKLQIDENLVVVDKATGIHTDAEGNEWATINALKKRFGVDYGSIQSRVGGLQTVLGRTKTRGGSVLYKVSDVQGRLREITESIRVDPQTNIYTDPAGMTWASDGVIARLMGVTRKVVGSRTGGLPTIEGLSHGKMSTLFPIERVKEQIRAHQELVIVDNETGIYTDEYGKTFAGISTIADLLNVDQTTVVDHLTDVTTLPGRDRSKKQVVLYSLEEVREKLSYFTGLVTVDSVTSIYLDKDGEEWAPSARIAEIVGSTEEIIRRRKDKLRFIPGRSRGGKKVDLFSVSDAKNMMKLFLERPSVDDETGIYTDESGREWATIGRIQKMMSIPTYSTAERLVRGLVRMEARGHSGEINIYPIEEARNRWVRENSALLEHGESSGRNKKLESFLAEMAVGTSDDAQAFSALIAFCGGSRAADVLFKFRPEYTKIPIDYVKNVLAEYLGDYLSVKRPFQLKDITPEAAKYFSDLTLKEGLRETIKQDCLAFYYKERKSGSKKGDQQVIDAYLDYAVEALGDLANTDIDDVVQEVVTYFNTLFSDIERPRSIVSRLGDERREFPDVNQRINYQELKEKKRLLIADEMGLGKSGSVIFAKEALHVRQAVLVVPSNVIPTWKKYLSDRKVEGGYFASGISPNVLTVESVQDLQKAGIENKDYIIISHERLSDPRYVEELQKLDFGMLAVDEMHLLKNLAGKRAEQLVELSQKIEGENKYLALLSGTPVPNTVRDIAMTLKLLYPEKFGAMEDKNLVSGILKGDLLDLRSLLLPRMQMKSLRESVEMPELRETIAFTELEGLERGIYEMLLEEDELTPTAKLQVLRQFLLNPEMVDPTPGIESSKINTLNESLSEIYKTKSKVVVFVNGYVEDILRGEKGITTKLKLPAEVEVSTIHGDVSKEERVRLQGDLKDPDKRMLLLVSGQTAGVGVDFSSADEVIFYNEPWTKYEKGQQLSRVYRPGLSHDLASSTMITRGTIEEGINKHIEAKYKSIEKLLNGIPLTEIEQEMLKVSEDEIAPNAEVNPELARYYFSSWERMMNIFSHVKEIGETDFQEFLGKFSREYAECYMELGSRSYQANANRVTGALIDAMVRETGQTSHEVTILDTASGPEMLKRHIPDALREHVVSMDLNAAHFSEGEGKRVVGSFLHIPLRAASVDYAAMTLAWHYTSFVPSQGKIERVEALKELHTVLKPGGRAILNLMYSLDIRKPEQLKPALERMGFSVVEEYSGDIAETNRYASKIITVEKVRENEETSEEIVNALIAADLVDGLKFRQNKKGLRNSRGMLTSFVLNGQKREVLLNEADQAIHEEEQDILERGEILKELYTEIRDIPPEEIVREGFSRVFNGKRYVLFSKLAKGPGVVVIK